MRIVHAAAGVAAGSFVAGIFLAEGGLRISAERRVKPDPKLAAQAAEASGARVELAEVAAADGVTLRGWLFSPPGGSGEAVIVHHGVGDSRGGVLDLVTMLLRHGFQVLNVDSRAHGVSGGSIVTYGILETEDVRRWVAWLRGPRGASAVYGLGESMGAAIMIQTLGEQPPFDAVVAECPFAGFESIVSYRAGRRTGIPQVLLWPVVRSAFLYARLRHGVDLYRADPLGCIRRATTPVLLIHGEADLDITPEHSRLLHEANPRSTELWVVPGAGHTNAGAIAREEFERRVVEWFRPRR